MKYNNPIIREVYLECYFNKIVDTNMQYKIMSLFNKNNGEIQIEPDISSIPIGNAFPIRIRLWNDGRSELFQVFNNRVAFNHIHINGTEYLGWEYFYKIWLAKTKEITGSIDDIRWGKVGICYLNQIDCVDDVDFKLGKYINCNGEIVPGFLAESNQATDLIIGQGNINIEKNIQIKIGLNKDQSDKFVIRTETQLQILLEEDGDLEKCLQSMHDEINVIFEGIISDFTKNNIMGGLK